MHITPTPISPTPTSASAATAELALTLLGPSAAMSHVWAQIRRLAPHVRTVLITGSPDAGQEAVARLLLDLSQHPRREFIVLDEAQAEDRLTRLHGSGCIPQDAFLFLPEVDRLSALSQNHLLRLLRTRRTAAFSIAAGTTEDLRSLVSIGRFSPELAQALGFVRITVPSLKDRVEDIPMLLTQTLAVRCQAAQRPVPQLSEQLLRAAMQYGWHGNLAELSAVAEDLLAHSEIGIELTLNDWQRAITSERRPRPKQAIARMVKLDTVIQEHIYSVLRGCRGNKLRAAEVLGISRSTLYRMLDAAAHDTALPLAS